MVLFICSGIKTLFFLEMYTFIMLLLGTQLKLVKTTPKFSIISVFWKYLIKYFTDNVYSNLKNYTYNPHLKQKFWSKLLVGSKMVPLQYNGPFFIHNFPQMKILVLS